MTPARPATARTATALMELTPAALPLSAVELEAAASLDSEASPLEEEEPVSLAQVTLSQIVADSLREAMRELTSGTSLQASRREEMPSFWSMYQELSLEA